jgi:hypothetical protein
MVTSGSSAGAPESAGAAVGGGRYVVVGSLGAGSQGETLDAVDKREGRPVAIKRFTLRGAKSWKDVELAEREASVLSSLNHPGLPRYVEHFEEDGALYLVMEKVEGETLAARRRRGQRLDQEQVLRFLREAGDCLRYLHGHAPPIVHRDIKPGNVILRPDGSYCLVDFGSVRDRLKPEGGSTVVGTFGFMPPEQFQGRAGPGSDVYAVGATALSLVTGREPEDLPHKGLSIDVEGALRGQVDRRLIAALRAMLEPDPDRRATSVDAALRGAGLRDPARSSAGATPNDVNGTSRETSAEAAKRARRERLEAEAAEARRERAEATRGQREDDIDAHYRRKAERRRQREAERWAEREERRARQFARKEARRAERYARLLERHAHRHHRPGPPVPPGRVLAAVILLALQIARLATFALFQLLLPLLFTVIYLPERRRRMLEIGQAGQRGLTRAREHIRYQFLGGPEPSARRDQHGSSEELDADRQRDFSDPLDLDDSNPSPQAATNARVATTPPPRTRISIDAEGEELELETPDPKTARR